MTPVALASAPADVERPKRLRRLPLAAKLGLAFVGLVAFVLVVNGAVEAWLSYQSARRAALDLEAEKARAAAERVEGFLSEIQTEIGWTAGAEWRFAKPEQQRYDFIRVLREAPAITALAFLDGRGKEQLAVSRLEPDSVASGKDFSQDPRFLRAVADKTWFGPVEFRRGSEPYMTIAIAHVGKTSGVTVADVNLKLIWDVISAIHVGDRGYAFVVDSTGRLIADPDLSLVLRDTDLSALPQVRAALAALSGPAPDARPAEVAAGRDGADVLTAYAVAAKPRWIVFVQQPLREAFAPVAAGLWRTGALLGVGLLLALVSGAALARRMTAPIRVLQAGAERLGVGDLGHRIEVRTGDEIEALAGGFNAMAGRLKDSYETLEARVEARTRDLNEALAQQTATADVLKTISRSVFDLDNVLRTLIDTAVRLCRGSRGTIFLRNGDLIEGRAFHSNVPPALRDHIRANPLSLDVADDDVTLGVVASIRESRIIHHPDLVSDRASVSERVRALAAFGAVLYVPLMRDGQAIGCFGVPREQAVAFTEREIELVKTFADQAVIAIENARLFEEVQARTREVERALERQTATAEILRVIAASPSDVQPVFEAVAERAMRLFGAWAAIALRFDGELLHFGAARGALPDTEAFVRARFPAPPTVDGPYDRCLKQMAPLHVGDLQDTPNPDFRNYALKRGLRAALYVPVQADGRAIGLVSVSRNTADAFSDDDARLLTSFADQAAIAMRNVSLFNETQESLAQQTATAEVLKTISRSAFDLQTVLDTLAASAKRLMRAAAAGVYVRKDDVLVLLAHTEDHLEVTKYVRANPIKPGRNSMLGRALLTGQIQNVGDYYADEEIDPRLRSMQTPPALLVVPMVRNGVVVGAINVAREEKGQYTSREVELLETFADQAVIALDNTRLLEEVQARTRELEQSLADLRKAQDRLVQSEKLASLGQLTAGIAHEIKNPLNFVNNFASLSRELLEELRDSMKALPEGARADADDLMAMIDSNLEKVASHGKRADSIVKNMLLHSREGSGERTSVNINAMVEEALNLGYHGTRAEKPGFNVTLEKSFDPEAGEADIYLQEITRVLLNLISNGFYASDKRRRVEGADFAPSLRATTRGLGHSVEIRIRDNGTGIPDSVREKMFNPFFTTKPAGEGTGLGLSLSHDIVVKQHGGTIDVETEPGAFTEFIITLPRKGART